MELTQDAENSAGPGLGDKIRPPLAPAHKVMAGWQRLPVDTDNCPGPLGFLLCYLSTSGLPLLLQPVGGHSVWLPLGPQAGTY